MNKLTIVWQRARKSVWEDDWIEYLFQNIPHTTIENLNHNLYVDNSVIVDAICWAPYHNNYISNLTAKNFKFGLIHLTDESCADDISSYKYCKFVLRNYYRPNVEDHVLHFPLGWNDGFRQITDNNPYEQRSNTWAFVGERWDQNRNSMVKSMSSVSGGKIYVAKQHGPRLSVSEMSKIYRDSIFIPCPKGALSIDSFRVTEAFEAGCIPIVEKSDYWAKLHGNDFPALQIDNWLDAPNVIKSIITNNEHIKLGNICKTWWEKSKTTVINKVEDLVTDKMMLFKNNNNS